MSAPSLMSRAKELLQQRAAGSALVIVPLALAAPAAASSVFDLGSTGVNGAISGGAFGHAYSSLTGGGQGVELTGDTLTGSGDGTPLTAHHAAHGSTNGDFTYIVFDWQGNFEPGTTFSTSDNFLLINSVFPKTMPEDAGSISWTIYASIFSSDPDSPFLAYQVVNSFDPNDPLLIPVTQAGGADSWEVQLAVQWTFPMSESEGVFNADPSVADAELDATPLIDLSLIPSVGSSIPPESTPLPAAVWPGAALLGLLGAGAVVRNVRPRRTA